MCAGDVLRSYEANDVAVKKRIRRSSSALLYTSMPFDSCCPAIGLQTVLSASRPLRWLAVPVRCEASAAEAKVREDHNSSFERHIERIRKMDCIYDLGGLTVWEVKLTPETRYPLLCYIEYSTMPPLCLVGPCHEEPLSDVCSSK